MSAAMESRSDHIRSRGAEYFDQLTANREEETLHLEFKTLSHEGGQLTRDDRKLIATAVTGLANAEGGVLIIGIKTDRVDGIDVAVAKRTVKELQRTTNLVRSAIPEMMSPQHTGIIAFSVTDAGKEDEGFIVIEVPASSDRPHYSNVHHQYFRRGSNGTRLLEHAEIRELMFAVRVGSLEVRLHADPTVYTGTQIGVNIVLSLGNVGPVPVRAPFLRISPGTWTATSGLQEMRHRGETKGLYAKTDQLVHVGDEFQMATKSSGIEFRVPNIARADLISKIRQTKNEELFSIKPAQGSDPTDRLFGPFEVSFGAENALTKTARFDFSKWDMFEMIIRSIPGS
jgi:hypothetical protein